MDAVNPVVAKEKKENIFKRFGHGFVNFFRKSIPNFFIKMGRGIKNFFVNFHRRFMEGSIGTKISHFICGFGNLYHGQIIKGIIYLALEVGFVLFMVLCPTVDGPNHIKVPMGYKALINLKLEGHEAGFDPITGKLIPADDSRLMLLLGLLTIIIILLFVVVWFSSIKSSFLADQAVKEGRKPSSFKEDLKALVDGRFHILMLTPTCIAALAFTVLPTIFMICMAFTTYNTLEMTDQGTSLFHWNGGNNFVYMFTGESALGKEISARFFPVLGWTFIWAILATFTCYFGGILLALLINKKGLKGKKIFRTIFILTIALPQFVSLLAIRQLLSSGGPINSLITSWGWSKDAINFLGNDINLPHNEVGVKAMIILINMWLGIPYTMLMTSGILMNIPTDLYEAAKVDGTSKPKMFFKITLPYVIFVTTPYLIGSFVGNINSFNTIFLLTGGGPSVSGAYKAGETDLLVTWLYKLTIENGDYNTGAVIGILTFIITATITLITYRRSKAYNEEDTFQ